MKQCPYAAQILVRGTVVYARCERRSVLGSPGWHHHDAAVPPICGMTGPGIRIRWRSTSAPDYHVAYRDRVGIAPT